MAKRMGMLSIYQPPSENRSVPFCKCGINNKCNTTVPYCVKSSASNSYGSSSSSDDCNSSNGGGSGGVAVGRNGGGDDDDETIDRDGNLTKEHKIRTQKRIISNNKSHICQCGEMDSQELKWTWDTNLAHPETKIDEQLVVFHPTYSQGTSVIRGNQPLDTQHIHYWEIKIISCMGGTDLMIGIGTESVNLTSHQYKFASFLGLNDQSWGYSYRGFIHHQERLKHYGKKYIKGCIVGVYLDLFKGHIEFYLNRRPQGIAYRNIPIDKNVRLYPMICSTSAKSSVKLINSTSLKENLQFHCMKVIGKYPELINQIKQIPGLVKLCSDMWFLQFKEQFQYSEFQQNNLLLEDEAILGNLGKSKKLKYQIESEIKTNISQDPLRFQMIAPLLNETASSSGIVDVYNTNDEDDDDIYKGMLDIKHEISLTNGHSSSSDDDDDLTNVDLFGENAAGVHFLL